MKLGPETKVHDLLTTYPFIKEYLINLHPHFKKLNNPILAQTLARIANLNRAADAVNIPVDTFISGIAEEIKDRTGKAVELEKR